MVEGIDALRARFAAIPEKIREEVAAELERCAEDLCADIRRLVPVPDIEIGWSWGEAGRGALSIGTVGSRDSGGMRVTIWAKGKNISPRWFEFGTAPRFTRLGAFRGAITAQPFFYPAYRANRTRIRSRLTRAVTRGFKKL